ncbi:Elongator complex protein 2 [Cyphellophora attinorum]|uniref:Elongator complex protein 2 n=1 Tax=Cyphellophora attinorum TaxID=1664694 RepID=A0A0N1HSG5_9EURO|nr:Elongator complex protein 2 [Phialophora attinorum]KPI41556.1 Elongator complex protein 2 [Phialophora attinorum]
MSAAANTEHISVGGNRQTSASDWSKHSGVLAYGADQNIALWKPLGDNVQGVYGTLRGHTAKVTALTFGQVDDSESSEGLVSGSADVQTKPRFIPLSLAFAHFEQAEGNEAAFMVAGGTRNDVQLYGIKKPLTEPEVTHCASLVGHEGWIRSLKLKRLHSGEYLLASTSADKYVRIWKFKPQGQLDGAVQSTSNGPIQQSSLNAKVQTVSVDSASYSVTFEALLLGHEDWVYSAAWNPRDDSQQLLSASADGTLTIWEPDETSGIWVSVTRLGEISGQKGATTATGSSGGFWSALWSPEGDAVTCLGRTGSWRLWKFDHGQQYWTQRTAVTGHVGSVNSLIWSPDGSYLLSTSSDQTTRLHAEWRQGTKRTWHEFARPQIHGYDLNCISAINSTQFASGADEKLLRVFDEPKSASVLLSRLSGIESSNADDLPETAAIPVLGLSNKAMDETIGENGVTNGDHAAQTPAFASDASVDHLNEPPTEDLLARYTLWPEREKLYGHGYEISTSASDGDILATACKASSLDHAVIRMYDTKSWTEIRPALSAHTLTVTRLAWSHPTHTQLLSVGRDRQWAVFKKIENTWQLLQCKEKAHSRMILDAAWSPSEEHLFFATAGRDKTVKLWSASGETSEYTLAQTLTRKKPVTAVALAQSSQEGKVVMAVGEEDGSVSVHVIDAPAGLQIITSREMQPEQCPSKTITQLIWRPQLPKCMEEGPGMQLAIASADCSVRISRVDVDALLPG